VAHFLHLHQAEFTFLDAAAVRSVMVHGGIDTVFIHTLHTLSGRYIKALLKDPKIPKDMINVNVFQPEDLMLGKMSLRTLRHLTRVLVLQLEAGGIILPRGALVIGNLSSLLQYESVVYTGQETGKIEIIFAHNAARLGAEALRLAQSGYREEDPLEAVLQEHPEYVHKLSGGVLEQGSELLADDVGGSHLADVMENKVVMLNPSMRTDHLHVMEKPGTIAALLRFAWYDSPRYINEDSLV